jgi:hypothetical protein
MTLYQTVSNPADVEILLAIDSDDLPTVNYIPNLLTKYEMFKIRPFFRANSGEFVFINRDYYNWLAEQATGDYLWVSADDLTYQVQGWDIKIKESIESYLVDKPDRIMCAGVKDNTPKPSPHLPNFPCFPLITKEAFQYFKFILHPFVPTWGADYLLYVLYKGFDRYHVVADATYLNHVSYHTHQCEADGVTKRIGHTFNRLKMMNAHNIDKAVVDVIPGQVEAVKQYILNWRPNERVE